MPLLGRSEPQTILIFRSLRPPPDLNSLDAFVAGEASTPRTTTHVRVDTENALRLLSSRGVIFWHNFADRAYADVTRYLLELSSDLALYRVRRTLLAAFCAGGR
jgi:hypothetical protein